MRISRETQIQSVSSFACPASPRPLPCLFTLEYVPKMQPLRARPNAPAATIFQQCAQRAITKTAAAQRRPSECTRSDHLPAMRPTHRHENRRHAAPHAQTHPQRPSSNNAPNAPPRKPPPRSAARPNAHPRRPPFSSNAPNAPSRKPPPHSAARPNAYPRANRRIPAMRPTRRPFGTSSDLPIISRIAPPRISFVENAHTLSVKYCAVPFARRHAHMLSPRAHNYSCHARARPMRRPEPLQRAARRFPIQFESQ